MFTLFQSLVTSLPRWNLGGRKEGMQGNLGFKEDGARTTQKPVKGRPSKHTCALIGQKEGLSEGTRDLEWWVIFCQPHLSPFLGWGQQGGWGRVWGLFTWNPFHWQPPISLLSSPFLHSPGHVIEGTAQLRKQQVGFLTPTLHSCHQD